MTQWSSSVSLITGAASGMGREMALRAARLGGQVHAWDLDADGLASLQEQGEGRIEPWVVDVTDRHAVQAASAEAGRVDILVNNAGIVDHASLLEADPTGIERVMSVNALSLFWVTRAVLPAMAKRNAGHLVTVASSAGLVPVRNAVSYTASKHAAIGFHDALRQELRFQAPGIRMTLVTPFFVDTGMFAGVRSRFPLLLPIVPQDRAVELIMSAVQRDRRRVIMPATASLAYLYRLLPAGVSDVLLDALGISVSMDSFTGRLGASDRQSAR